MLTDNFIKENYPAALNFEMYSSKSQTINFPPVDLVTHIPP